MSASNDDANAIHDFDLCCWLSLITHPKGGVNVHNSNGLCAPDCLFVLRRWHEHINVRVWVDICLIVYDVCERVRVCLEREAQRIGVEKTVYDEIDVRVCYFFRLSSAQNALMLRSPA